MGFPIGLDAVSIGGALVVAIVLRSSPLVEQVWSIMGAVPPAEFAAGTRSQVALLLFQWFSIPTLLYALGQYRLVRDPAANWSFNRVVAAVTASFAALILILYVLGIGTVPRVILGLDFLLILVLTVAWRDIYHHRVRARHRDGIGLRNVLVIGTTPLAQRVAGHFARHPTSGRRVVGFLSPDRDQPLLELPPGIAERNDVSLPGIGMDVQAAIVENTRAQPRHLMANIGDPTTDLEAALDGLNVEEVFVDPSMATASLGRIMNACQERAIAVQLIPEHHRELGIQPRAWQSGPFTFLDVHSLPISRLGAIAKRTVDILAASAALLILSPVILACVLAVKIENPKEKAFYGGKRIGLKGHHFRQWKFSTMRPDADNLRDQLKAKNARDGPWFQLDEDDDPRITKTGRFLRKYSLNDIPQFWNVLKGDMSMVGPRPLAVDEVARFVDFDIKYYRIFDVKPGITGLWQISDRMNPSFDYRVEKDFEYIAQWNIWMDIKIMLMTPFAMLKGGR